MLFGDELKLIGWLLFASIACKLVYWSVVRLQIEYLARPQSVIAEILMHTNAFIGTLLVIIWLHRLLVGKA